MARGRDAKGRFKKGSGGSKRKARRSSGSTRSTSTALVRAAPAQVIRVSAPRAVAKRSTRGVGRRRHGGGSGVAGDLSGGIIAVLKRRSKQLGGSVGYGWITASGTETAVKIKEFIDKIPTVDMIGKPATHGLGFLFLATQTGGFVRTASDALAMGALHRAAYNLGASGFDFEKAAAVGDDEEMAGDMD